MLLNASIDFFLIVDTLWELRDFLFCYIFCFPSHFLFENNWRNEGKNATDVQLSAFFLSDLISLNGNLFNHFIRAIEMHFHFFVQHCTVTWLNFFKRNIHMNITKPFFVATKITEPRSALTKFDNETIVVWRCGRNSRVPCFLHPS